MRHSCRESCGHPPPPPLLPPPPPLLPPPPPLLLPHARTFDFLSKQTSQPPQLNLPPCTHRPL
jgi:hypothetical protein